MLIYVNHIEISSTRKCTLDDYLNCVIIVNRDAETQKSCDCPPECQHVSTFLYAIILELKGFEFTNQYIDNLMCPNGYI